MKKLIYLCIIAVVLSSCGYKEAQDKKRWEENARIRREQKRQDSIRSIREDSLAQFAWENVKFGTSKDVLKSTIPFVCASDYGNHLSMESDTRYMMKEHLGLKEMYSFEAYFEENELTSIRIKSFDVSADHIDDLEDDCRILIRKFTDEVGDPTTLKDKVSIFDFNEGDEFKLANFRIGEKNISVTMGETYSGGEFYYDIYICNFDFPKKKLVPTKEELKKEKEEQERYESVMNSPS